MQIFTYYSSVLNAIKHVLETFEKIMDYVQISGVKKEKFKREHKAALMFCYGLSVS